MTNRLLLFIIGFQLCSCHFRPVKNELTVARIPFELTDHNNIVVEAIINGNDTVSLMFHTAASSLDLIKEASQRVNTVDWNNEVEVNTWGGQAEARVSEHSTLEIGHLKWDSLTIWENENSGPNTDGKFGPNLFAGRAIEINFDKQEIALHETVPKYAEDYVKMPISHENGMLFINCSSTIEEDTYPNDFLIHSGFGGTVLYDDEFVDQSEIGNRITIESQQDLKDSYGNVLTTKRGKIPLFVVGEVQFDDMPVGFFEGTIGQQRMSVLGGALLKRFNIIIDGKREFIYLKSNDFTRLPFTEGKG